MCLELPEAKNKIDFISTNVDPGFVKIELKELPRKLLEDPVLSQKFRKHFVKTVCGVDYFDRNKAMSWFQGILQKVLNSINEKARRGDPLLRTCNIIHPVSPNSLLFMVNVRHLLN